MAGTRLGKPGHDGKEGRICLTNSEGTAIYFPIVGIKPAPPGEEKETALETFGVQPETMADFLI
jgi:hypothetical protein